MTEQDQEMFELLKTDDEAVIGIVDLCLASLGGLNVEKAMTTAICAATFVVTSIVDHAGGIDNLVICRVPTIRAIVEAFMAQREVVDQVGGAGDTNVN